MAIETEIKYRLRTEQFERVREDLDEFGAEYVGEDFEENIIYGGGPLEGFEGILRIRKIGRRTLLTFKKRMPGEAGIKNQIEHETSVGDAAATGEIVAQLGLEKLLIYEKRRRTWRLRGAEVTLDELPFGLFMEIEGPVGAIREAAFCLGAEEFETEHRTYPQLTAEHGRPNGKLREARFGSAEKTGKTEKS